MRKVLIFGGPILLLGLLISFQNCGSATGGSTSGASLESVSISETSEGKFVSESDVAQSPQCNGTYIDKWRQAGVKRIYRNLSKGIDSPVSGYVVRRTILDGSLNSFKEQFEFLVTLGLTLPPVVTVSCDGNNCSSSPQLPASFATGNCSGRGGTNFVSKFQLGKFTFSKSGQTVDVIRFYYSADGVNITCDGVSLGQLNSKKAYMHIRTSNPCDHGLVFNFSAYYSQTGILKRGFVEETLSHE